MKETFDGRFAFLHTGLANIETRGQILHFFKSLRDFGCTERRCPKNWFEALATKKIGMSRSEIAELTGIHGTGRLSDMLDTLVASGFLRWYRGYGKKKRDGIYQLIDNFTLFHFRFLAPPPTDEHFWSATLASQTQAVWRGLAFERS